MRHSQRKRGATDGPGLRSTAPVLDPTDLKKIAALAGEAGAKLRDRRRRVKWRILEIGRASGSKGEQGKAKLQQGYRKLVEVAPQVVGQAKRFSQEIAEGVKRASEEKKQAALEGLRQQLDTFVPRVKQVIQQTKVRVFGGDRHAAGKLVSLFEPASEVIRKGKASKPTEFGKMVKIREAQNQIITDYEVYPQRPSDCDLVILAIEAHEEKCGRTPRLA